MADQVSSFNLLASWFGANAVAFKLELKYEVSKKMIFLKVTEVEVQIQKGIHAMGSRRSILSATILSIPSQISNPNSPHKCK